MILFYGQADDSPLQRAVEAARAASCRHVVVDQRHLASHELVLAIDGRGLHGRIVVAGEQIDLADVGAVYARPLELPRAANPVDELRARTFHAGMVEWLDVAVCLVVNRPSAMESNSSKPYQAQLIARLGFEVPETLITSEPDEALAFRRTHGRVIYKSTGGVRSIVRELDDRATARLALLRLLPTQFQAYVPGVDVRVHVVGQEVFATEVSSDATDYRYADRDGLETELTPVMLPEAVEARCLRMAERLGLVMCGIDLRRRPDGRWVCFEVNPMPAYSYYEANAGQEISCALVNLLGTMSQERFHAGG